MGLLQKKRIFKPSNKLTKKQQQLFLKLLADLLANGFNIQESFSFMKKSNALPQHSITFLVEGFSSGIALQALVEELGFSTMVSAQLSFATAHGDLVGTLQAISEHFFQTEKYRQQFYKIISYPLLLIVFLILVIVGIRQFLLPQLMENDANSYSKNIGILLIVYSPYILVTLVFVLSFSFFILNRYLKHQSAIQRAFIYLKLPIIRGLYREYVSAFFALEWGKLLAQGLEMKEVIDLMRHTTNYPLMKELAGAISEGLLVGETLHRQLAAYPFFTKALGLMIRQGEVKGKLGKELMVYSNVCFQGFFKKIERVITLVQPFIFIIIACLIIGVYGAMLLPIYGNMEGVL
ncbi:competence type IV pilus assembly protein ComGB [Enterococcus faecalis]|uniref:competence type IV pilus assembly protein ComGB n=1 Tax=Enterococcus faecalis TaxID=1351 RepID=UPI003CC640A1